HHLFASLGCATENLSLAARARGKSGEARFETSGQGRVRVDLGAAQPQETDLFAAIPARQCSRVTYDGKAAPADALARLEAAANRYGVEAVFATDEKTTEGILNLVVKGNSRQIDDPAFVAELKDWIRFNPEAALAARDGLYTAASGNPTLPVWLGSLFFDLFFTKGAENDKYVEQVRSSAGIVVFVAATNDKQGWVNAGRAYQRFALQATVDGLKHAFVNQPVEVPELRGELQALLGIGDRRPNLVVRFGYGPIMPKSLRRRVGDVIV
ncbi:MAG: Acg family FMN-binding oxidoreductase, partial [Methyloligellaceae bacterium]